MHLEEIKIRDPFVLCSDADKTYYLYGTTDENPWEGKAQGFAAYTSQNLQLWEGPFPVFAPPHNFWADTQFWAPEVHFYRGAYYMLASFKADGRPRGVQILKADTPLGPFVPQSDGPLTPKDWECLDGTLYFDGEHTPWLVFSHEWTQIHDGAMCCMRLSEDLSTVVSSPEVLFHASESGWSIPYTGEVVRMPGENYVTDGPFLYKTHSGALLMIWSSYSKSGYSIGLARSRSGTLQGPWRHEPRPLFAKDGGHGMLFRTFEGTLLLAIHQPNTTPLERTCFFPAAEQNDTLILQGDEWNAEQ